MDPTPNCDYPCNFDCDYGYICIGTLTVTMYADL